MTSPEPQPHQLTKLPQLVEALHTMRDTLVLASLELRDFQFEMDKRRREVAQDHAAAVLQKVGSK